MLDLIIVWVVTAISLLVLTRLPLGIRVDSFTTALLAAVILGLLNAVVKPLLVLLTLPATILTLGLFLLVVNALVFALAASLIKGFEIRGWLAALVGPVALTLVNSVLFWLLGR